MSTASTRYPAGRVRWRNETAGCQYAAADEGSLLDRTRLHASGEKVALTILGPGIPVEVVLESFDASVRPFVTVIDRVPEDRVMAEYRRHDALLWTSTYEGFGLVLIEAMSQGLPPIATPAGCAASIVHDNENGLLIPGRNVDALVDAVKRLLSNAALRLRLGAGARRTVADMTWRATAERTLEEGDQAGYGW